MSHRCHILVQQPVRQYRVYPVAGRVQHAAFVILISVIVGFRLTNVHGAEISTGSGVVIGANGQILTNSHVADDCETIAIKLPLQSPEAAAVVARDAKNDLTVIRVKSSLAAVASFRQGSPIRAGDTVVALGYPLSGLLASAANLTVGNVSALAGLGDDTRYLQISAPVQSGNSGGPLLDASSHVVGIVTAKLDAARVARSTGDIPQNVNFALKAEVVRTFLDSNGIRYQTAPSNRELSSADVGEIARPFTVHIRCAKADAPSSINLAKKAPATLVNPKMSAAPCTSAFQPLRSEAERHASALKEGIDRKEPRPELCKLFRNFSEAEEKVVVFVDRNWAGCGIPQNSVATIIRNHAKTIEVRNKVCSGDTE